MLFIFFTKIDIGGNIVIDKIINEYVSLENEIVDLRKDEKGVWIAEIASVILIAIGIIMCLVAIQNTNVQTVGIIILLIGIGVFILATLLCLKFVDIYAYPNFVEKGINRVKKEVLQKNKIETMEQRNKLLIILRKRIEGSDIQYSIGISKILVIFFVPIYTYVCDRINDNVKDIAQMSSEIIYIAILCTAVSILFLMAKSILKIRIDRTTSRIKRLILVIEEIGLLEELGIDNNLEVDMEKQRE